MVGTWSRTCAKHRYADPYGRPCPQCPADQKFAAWQHDPVIREVDAHAARKNKYTRTVKGVDIDVYDVLQAWGVTCPATQHAIKKLLAPGQRGQKDKAQDLREALASVQRAIEMEGGG